MGTLPGGTVNMYLHLESLCCAADQIVSDLEKGVLSLNPHQAIQGTGYCRVTLPWAKIPIKDVEMMYLALTLF